MAEMAGFGSILRQTLKNSVALVWVVGLSWWELLKIGRKEGKVGKRRALFSITRILEGCLSWWSWPNPRKIGNQSRWVLLVVGFAEKLGVVTSADETALS